MTLICKVFGSSPSAALPTSIVPFNGVGCQITITALLQVQPATKCMLAISTNVHYAGCGGGNASGVPVKCRGGTAGCALVYGFGAGTVTDASMISAFVKVKIQLSLVCFGDCYGRTAIRLEPQLRIGNRLILHQKCQRFLIIRPAFVMENTVCEYGNVMDIGIFVPLFARLSRSTAAESSPRQ